MPEINSETAWAKTKSAVRHFLPSFLVQGSDETSHNAIGDHSEVPNLPGTTVAQEINNGSDDTFYDAIGDQKTLEVYIANVKIQKKINEMQRSLIKESLSSEDIFLIYEKAKKQIKRLVDVGVNPADIAIADRNIAIKQKSDQLENQDKENLEAFRTEHKGKSITDKLKQANKDEKVLGALVDGTLDYLKNAFKLSPKDMSHYRLKVQDIYTHHGDRVSEAHTLYQYYDLQRRKHELKAMSFGKDKLRKQAYNILSLNARKNRRYKIRLTESLEAEEARREHLVEKYGHVKLEKGGKRGREKSLLDDLIQAKKEYEREKIAHTVSFDHVLSIVEDVHKDLIQAQQLSREEIQGCKEVLQMSLDNFKSRVLQTTTGNLDTNYQNRRRDIRLRRLIKKYGNHPFWGDANNVASDGGGVLTVAGTVITGLSVAGAVA
jgi:hypothetical protein